MPPKDHGRQYEDEYNDPMGQRWALRHSYGQYLRKNHGKTKSNPKVVDSYSEELWELVVAWKYFLCDAKPGLSIPWANTV